MSFADRASDLIHSITWSFRRPMPSPETVRDIEDLWRQLDNGERRLRPSAVALSLAWFPGQEREVDHGTQLMSDYGVTTDPGGEQSFFEEVAVFENAIEMPSEYNTSAVMRGRFSMSRRVQAFENWNRYALPLRVRGQSVVHIRPPRDLMGSPLVEQVGIEDFVADVAEKTAGDAYRIVQLKAQLTIWRITAALLAIMLVVRWMSQG